MRLLRNRLNKSILIVLLSVIVLSFGVGSYRLWIRYANNKTSLVVNSSKPSSSEETATKDSTKSAKTPLIASPKTTAPTSSVPSQAIVTPALPSPYSSIASQCASADASYDNMYNAAVSTTQQNTNAFVNSLIEGSNGEYTPSLIQEINSDYQAGNTALNGEYQGYLTGIEGYQPFGGQKGRCTPNEGPPTLYPPYTGP